MVDLIKKYRKKIEVYLDDFTVQRKLMIMYVVCMIIPLVITDSVILGIGLRSEHKIRQREMQNIANAAQYNIFNEIDSASKLAKSIYTSRYINDFIDTEYASPLEYVTSYQQFFKDTLLGVGASQDYMQIRIYEDNPTIVNGSEFQSLEKIKDKAWYQYMMEKGKERGLFLEYDKNASSISQSDRKIYFFQRMNFYRDSKSVLVIEIDYRSIIRMMEKMNYGTPVYVCDGDRILISNGRYAEAGRDFDVMTAADKKNIVYSEKMNIYGQELTIHVLNAKKNIIVRAVQQLPYVFILIIVNIMLPLVMVRLLNVSFTSRIQELSEVFERVDEEQLIEIDAPRGQDEIGSLMRNYNKMVQRVNSLIQIVYKNRIREQEMMMARQNAELLALHSQINPHFLFNALESIRMHSIIKQEIETADMVQKLAVMQRQYVEWQEDQIQIERELNFVEAYLGLQKYRFGDRLSYKLDVSPECLSLQIPKLTLVTFVENACVHGIESKTTPGWIFVRVSIENEKLCLEIEDTGSGMNEDASKQLFEKMQNACLEMLKSKGRVGIVNACLRLKMISNDEVEFELDSDEGVGTIIQIRLPLSYV